MSARLVSLIVGAVLIAAAVPTLAVVEAGSGEEMAATPPAGSMARAIDKLETLHPGGRVIACSHGHTIPAYIAYLVASRGLEAVEPGWRGKWYRVHVADGDVTVELREGEDFPSE